MNTMNHHAEIEAFARRLIEDVRDESIRSCDRTLDGNHAIAARWKQAANGLPEGFLRIVIPDIVDCTLATLLRGIDQELFPLSFTTADGTTVHLSQDGFGELCGWFMGKWRFQFSRERTVDDFADLRSPTNPNDRSA
jgi:hypothetical protein